MTKDMHEVFGSGLVRVLKKVKKKAAGGTSKVVSQAFHVKKASPGDQYAATKGLRGSPPEEDQPEGDQDAEAPDGEAGPVNDSGALGVQPATRMMVKFHDVPWVKKQREQDADRDPIPAELRRKFQKGSGSIASNKPTAGMPVVTVVPTDRIFWGGNEPDVLSSLRSGSIRKMRLVGDNGMMVAKIDAVGAGAFYGYVWMESLRSPMVRQIWKDIIDFTQEGTLSMRATAAYETAKACGLDDMVPPVVHRVDSDGDVIGILPDALIEHTYEWVSRQTGKSHDDVRKSISGHATVQLVRGEPWAIESEKWFKNFFGNTEMTDALNNVWSAMPIDRRLAFLRMAALDFVIGVLDRSLGDIAFSDDDRHPVMVFGGELSCPCPKTIGEAYLRGGYGAYGDMSTGDSVGLPLYWSDVATMLAIRGGEAEILDFEEVGITVSSRMRGDRATELARSLAEHRLTDLQIAGILSRIWMLQTHSKDIAKDPYFAHRYYASIVSGQPDPNMVGIKDFVNAVMKKVIVGDFDFYKNMKAKGEKDANPS